MSDEINPMAHEEAEEMQAVDRYLLDELPAGQRPRFEVHYFECAECARAVEAGQAFVTQIRPTVHAAWWRHSGVAAAALLLGVAGGQQFWIARLKAPHANTVILAREREKGAEEITQTLTTSSATIEVSLPDDIEFPFYLVKIAGEGRKVLSQVVPAPAKDSEQRLSVQVTRGTLGSGHFAVRVEGLVGEDSKDGHQVDEVYQFYLK